MPRYLHGTIINMNDFATKKDIGRLEKKIDIVVNKAVEDLSEVIDQLAQNMHKELVTIKKDIADIKVSIDRLINTIDGFVKRLDDQETENAARDVQFERLLDWARKVSVKTGVPLENL